MQSEISEEANSYMLVTLNKKAAENLLNLNIGNQPLNPLKVEAYREKMNQGQWNHVEGSKVQIKKGIFTNGQHRLYAFIKSDLPEITLPFEVI